MGSIPVAAAGVVFCVGLALMWATSSLPAVMQGVSAVVAAAWVWVLVFVGKERLARTSVFSAMVGVAIAVLLSPAGVLKVLAEVANEFIVEWDVLTQDYVLPLAVGSDLGMVAMVAGALFIAGLCALLAIMLIVLGRPWVTILITSLIVVLDVLVEANAVWGTAFLGCGALLLAVVQVGATTKGRRGSYRSEQVRSSFVSLIPNLVLCLIIVFSLVAVIPRDGQAWSGAAGMRAQAMHSIDEFRFGSDTLPEGNFAAAHRMNTSEDGSFPTALNVDFMVADDVAVSYFRGFTGSVYTGSSFEQPPLTTYTGSWDGLFAWADELGFDPLIQQGSYELMNARVEDATVETSALTVVCEGANRRYGYAPYQVISAEGEDQLLDLYLRPQGFFGLNETQMEFVEGSSVNESFIPAEWIANAPESSATGDFIQAERAYRAFAHESYTAIDDDAAALVREKFFTGQGWDVDTDELYTVVTRVRSILEAQCTYTADPFSYNASDGDFVTWFLDQQHEGNAAAFAASAVLAFREAGVPARYVEGYVLSQASADALRAAGGSEAQLTARQAHAWAEVYIDGVGWTPIEVTPGFYDKSYVAEQTIEISKEVAGDGSESELSGSLHENWDDWIPEELRPFAWLGLALLVVLILLMIYAIAELQRSVRVKVRAKRLVAALDQAAQVTLEPTLTPSAPFATSALLYHRMVEAMKYAPWTFDESLPLDAAPAIAHACAIRIDDYTHAIELIERERFGQIPLNEHEARFIEQITEQIEEGVWRASTWPRRLDLRYKLVFSIPL